MKKVFLLITLVIMSCASSKESKEERCKKRTYKKFPLILKEEGGYVFKTSKSSIELPKNWNPFPTCYAFFHSPQKNLRLDSLNNNHQVFILLSHKEASLGYNRVKGNMSKDSIHFYNAFWNVNIPSSSKASKKIYEGKGKEGKYFVVDFQNTVESQKMRIIEMTYYKRGIIYSVTYSAKGLAIEEYYKDAMKIFDSFEIVDN